MHKNRKHICSYYKMRKTTFLYVFISISIILTFASMYVCILGYNNGVCAPHKETTEGFAEEKETKEGFTKTLENATNDAGNILVNLIGKLKHVSGYLSDSKVWSDRIEMFQMDPVELARRELNKPKE